MSGAWQTNFFGSDAGGTVRQLSNAAGAITDSFDFDAFGNLLGRTGATANNYLYRGEQFDPDLGIYYLRARYYDQQRGRFRSQDPFTGWLDDPASLHKYLYAGGDPVNLIDPRGLASTAEYSLAAKRKEAKTAPAIGRLAQAIACKAIQEAAEIAGDNEPVIELVRQTGIVEFIFRCKCKPIRRSEITIGKEFEKYVQEKAQDVFSNVKGVDLEFPLRSRTKVRRRGFPDLVRFPDIKIHERGDRETILALIEAKFNESEYTPNQELADKLLRKRSGVKTYIFRFKCR